MILKIFIAGWAILLSAILINLIAYRLNLATWYSFLATTQKIGILKALGKTPIASIVFLFGAYPFLLGAVAFFALKIFKQI